MIGLIGKKVGMTRIFSESGESIPVTVVYAEPNIVIRKKTKENDGYEACVIGVGEKGRPNKSYSGIFKMSRIKPTKILQELRDLPQEWEKGKQITVNVFEKITNVNVTGYSKGRGFAGGMKRYGWKGGPAAHGSKFHRRPGSIGTSKIPGRILKGRNLPGRMGNCKITIKNLKVVKIDETKNLLFLRGAIPGATNSWVVVKCR